MLTPIVDRTAKCQLSSTATTAIVAAFRSRSVARTVSIHEFPTKPPVLNPLPHIMAVILNIL